jgi:uncharacterized membrane protein
MSGPLLPELKDEDLQEVGIVRPSGAPWKASALQLTCLLALHTQEPSRHISRAAALAAVIGSAAGGALGAAVGGPLGAAAGATMGAVLGSGLGGAMVSEQTPAGGRGGEGRVAAGARRSAAMRAGC